MDKEESQWKGKGDPPPAPPSTTMSDEELNALISTSIHKKQVSETTSKVINPLPLPSSSNDTSSVGINSTNSTSSITVSVSEEEAKNAREVFGRIKTKSMKKKKSTTVSPPPPPAVQQTQSLPPPPPCAAGAGGASVSVSVSVSGSALRLLQLAGSGDREGCLAAIRTMHPSDLNQPLPPAYTPGSSTSTSGGSRDKDSVHSKDKDKKEEGVTFILRAVELHEVGVVRALLEAGASCAGRTSSSVVWPRGRDAWSQACMQGMAFTAR